MQPEAHSLPFSKMKHVPSNHSHYVRNSFCVSWKIKLKHFLLNFVLTKTKGLTVKWGEIELLKKFQIGECPFPRHLLSKNKDFTKL